MSNPRTPLDLQRTAAAPRHRVRRWLARALDGLLTLETLFELLWVIAGIGVLGYVAAAWVRELADRGHPVGAVLLAGAALGLAVLALARKAAALIALSAGGALCLIAYLEGWTDRLLP